MGTRRPRRGLCLCRRCALPRRGDTPRPRQIWRATKCDTLSVPGLQVAGLSRRLEVHDPVVELTEVGRSILDGDTTDFASVLVLGGAGQENSREERHHSCGTTSLGDRLK